MENYPELAFHTKILTVLAECISVLYRKSTQEYESKAERLKGKYLVSGILIPTNSKDVTKRMITLMTVMYQIVLHAYLINDSYLRIRVLHLVKENSRTANITFGWKLLKHLIGNFKEDKEFVIKEVFLNNSGAWFINEELFSRKVKQMKPDRILLDKYLLPLHHKKCSTAELKKIIVTVEPQIEVEFIIVPLEDSEKKIDSIIDELEASCARIEDLWEQNYDHGKHSHHFMEAIEEEQNHTYEIVSRIKTIYISSTGVLHVLSKLLDVSRRYNNHELFQYVLMKVVPLLYCMTDSNNKSLLIESENILYLATELNNVGKLYLEEITSEQDTFNIRAYDFGEGMKRYEKDENTHFYQAAMTQISPSRLPTKRYMVLRMHERRFYSLQKMYRYILSFLSNHFDVYVAVGTPLMEIAQVFKSSFIISPEILEFITLESIGFCLTSHL